MEQVVAAFVRGHRDIQRAAQTLPETAAAGTGKDVVWLEDLVVSMRAAGALDDDRRLDHLYRTWHSQRVHPETHFLACA